MAKLVIVTGRDLEIPFFGQTEERFRVRSIQGKWFFDVDVTSMLETLSPKRKMALRGGRDVDDIRSRAFKKSP